LRIWALKSYNLFAKSEILSKKIIDITDQVESNFLPNSLEEKYHEKAYQELVFNKYLPSSFSPSGYKTQFDAFANALVVLLKIGTIENQNQILEFASSLASETKLGLVPAFWPPVFQEDEHWNLLKNNCKYEFRNFPYEFHNGGSWPMVNGFVGLAMLSQNQTDNVARLLEKINQANAIYDFSFYENFNTDTQAPNGVAFCAWSAAATVLIHQSLHNNFKIIF
jgi:GH15 family glucan-1,4-alpha-glucosidase